eukprot:1548043-Pyramimonas_sp.AAC.1
MAAEARHARAKSSPKKDGGSSYSVSPSRVIREKDENMCVTLETRGRRNRNTRAQQPTRDAIRARVEEP